MISGVAVAYDDASKDRRPGLVLASDWEGVTPSAVEQANFSVNFSPRNECAQHRWQRRSPLATADCYASNWPQASPPPAR